eukprot:GILI01028600.1.p1 GENE.GILI01028600.1~~GILI01028600.1.p1  ORF type:complete len:185 (+),score=26.98 GILI01028600.1:50-604(+)
MNYKQSVSQQQRDNERVERGKIRRAGSPVSPGSPMQTFPGGRAGEEAPALPQQSAAHNSIHAYMSKVQQPTNRVPADLVYEDQGYGGGGYNTLPHQPVASRGEQLMGRQGALNEMAELDNDPLLGGGDYSAPPGTRPNSVFGANMSPQQSHSYDTPRKQATRWGGATSPNFRDDDPSAQEEYIL